VKKVAGEKEASREKRTRRRDLDNQGEKGNQWGKKGCPNIVMGLQKSFQRSLGEGLQEERLIKKAAEEGKERTRGRAYLTGQVSGLPLGGLTRRYLGGKHETELNFDWRKFF